MPDCWPACTAAREDPLALEATVDAVFEVLQPRNGMERACALRIAKLEIQIGRFRAFEAVNLSAATGDATHNMTGPGVFDAQYNAELFGDLAIVLQRDPATFTPAEWRDLLLGAAFFDDDLAELYELLDLDDPSELEGMHEAILVSTGYHQGGSLAEASRQYAQFARSEAERLPDIETELSRASLGVSHLLKNGTLDSHTKILARLSAALDRELNRYERLREITDRRAEMGQDWEDDTTDAGEVA